MSAGTRAPVSIRAHVQIPFLGTQLLERIDTHGQNPEGCALRKQHLPEREHVARRDIDLIGQLPGESDPSDAHRHPL